MTRDEEVLRRVLHAAADSIEPAPDGLTLIRARVTSPRSASVAWLLGFGSALAGFALLGLRAAAPAWARLTPWLRPVLEPVQAWFADDGARHARRRPLWRRPSVAIAAVVFAAAATGIVASGLPSAISQSSAPGSAARADGPVTGQRTSGLNGSGQPYGSSPSGRHGRRGATATPSPSCSPSGKKSGTTPSPSQAPSQTPSPTPSATPSPTASPSPTPSPSAPTDGTLQGTSPGTTLPGAEISPPAGTQALSGQALSGTGSAPEATPSPTPSC
jgi:hypothetical protein